jgi:uncharacterized protein YndB with AHSA1/START domain
LHKEDSMETVEREIVVSGTPEEAWRAVVESDWLGEHASVDPRPGGEVETAGRRGFVEEVDAPRRLTFWWSEENEDATRVEIELEERDDGTLVRVLESRPLAMLDANGPEVVFGVRRESGPQMVAA